MFHSEEASVTIDINGDASEEGIYPITEMEEQYLNE